MAEILSLKHVVVTLIKKESVTQLMKNRSFIIISFLIYKLL